MDFATFDVFYQSVVLLVGGIFDRIDKMNKIVGEEMVEMFV